jgi:hypothetical protein
LGGTNVKAILREEESGVSEVLGTILILGMTVTLFSVVILWVSSMPTPIAQTRVDVQSGMVPLLNAQGAKVGVQISLTHQGGEALYPVPTIIYVTDQQGSGPQTTDVVTLHTFNIRLVNPNGLIDGADSVWSIGERWEYRNFAFRDTDQITITIVDTGRGLVVWSGEMNPGAGTRPPVFLSVWAAGVVNKGLANPVYAGAGFYLFAQVFSPDDDLNPNSVYATITAWSGSGTTCEMPLQMHDDRVFPDQLAGDGIFSLGSNVCMNAPYPALSWAGTYILLNATDAHGHQSTTRFTLNVAPNPSTITETQTIPSQLWQYIGYIQIRTGEVWVSNLNNPYTTTATFQPYRVTVSQLNTNGGALFHLKMANHGNTTIFVDGWSLMSFSKETSASVFAVNIVRPVSATLPANGGGIAAYPGTPTNPNDFQFAQVFDINPADQENGGTPVVLLMASRSNFKSDWPQNFVSNSYFINILVSGMAGPVNYTSAMLRGLGPNPLGCSGLGASYNPYAHLNDPISACRSTWYAQVIPFIGMVVY